MINAVGSKGSTIWNNSARAAGASCACPGESEKVIAVRPFAATK